MLPYHRAPTVYSPLAAHLHNPGDSVGRPCGSVL